MTDFYSAACIENSLTPWPAVISALDAVTAQHPELTFDGFNFSDSVHFKCVLVGLKGKSGIIQNLCLKNSGLGPSHVIMLCETLSAAFGFLRTIDLSENDKIDATVGKHLFSVVQRLTTLRLLNLGHTNVSQDIIRVIDRTMNENEQRRSVVATPRDLPTPKKQQMQTVSESSPAGRLTTPLLTARAKNLELRDNVTFWEERTNNNHVHLLEKLRQIQQDQSLRHKTGHTHLDELTKNSSSLPYESEFDGNLPGITEAAQLEIYESLYTNSRVVNEPLISQIMKKPTKIPRMINEQELLDRIRKLSEMVQDDTLTVESIMDAVRKTDENVGKIRILITEDVISKDKAADIGDVQAVEVCVDSHLVHSEELMELYLKRLQLLGSEGVCGQRLDAAGVHAKDIHEILEVLEATDSDVCSKVEADLDRIGKYVKSQDHQRILAESEHQCTLKQMFVDIETNEKAQNQAWEEIYTAVNKLNDLATSRHKLIQGTIEEREKRDRAQGIYEGMKRHALHMANRLTTLTEAVKSSLNFMSTCKDYASSLHDTIKQRMSTILEATREAALVEQKEYLTVFQNYYLSLGGLLHSKTKQLEDLDRMIRNNNFQIEVCLETLDANVVMYQKLNQDFTAKRDEVANKIDDLRYRGDEQYDFFRPTENALLDCGYEFTRPCVLFEEQNVALGQKMLGLRKAHFGQDQDSLTVQEEVLKKTAVAAEHARKSGLSSLIKPLTEELVKGATPRKPTKGTPRRIVDGGDPVIL
eukprot:PhF_6_TR14882/c0_g1_i1/m.23189